MSRIRLLLEAPRASKDRTRRSNDTVPSPASIFVIRDRDGVYGFSFRDRVKAMDIEEVVIAPQSPWQNPYAERVIGTLRRECLAHVVVLGEMHLRRIVRHHLNYYHGARTHLALEKDAPVPRSIQPPEQGRVIEISEVGGLHHRYERRAE